MPGWEKDGCLSGREVRGAWRMTRPSLEDRRSPPADTHVLWLMGHWQNDFGTVVLKRALAHVSHGAFVDLWVCVRPYVCVVHAKQSGSSFACQLLADLCLCLCRHVNLWIRSK